MAKYNLHSPSAIQSKCLPENSVEWLKTEVACVSSASIRAVIQTVSNNLADFVRFPQRAVLLWDGCNRVAPEGKRQRYHNYPELIRHFAKSRGIRLDTRPNGPAILAYLFADGERPIRTGSANSWSIHHLYSGKFPYLSKTKTLHAQKENRHFTQSAGLVAVHPVADAICDEFPCFTWFLRAEAFRRFGYDPDGVFGPDPDDYGFIPGKNTAVIEGGAKQNFQSEQEQ